MAGGKISSGITPPPSAPARYHEAAHAVAAVAVGIPLVRVSVVLDDDAEGRIDLEEPEPHLRPGFHPVDPDHRRNSEDWMLMTLVGEFADAKQSGRAPDFRRRGDRWDLRHVLKLARRLAPGRGERRALLGELFRKARAFVDDPLRWRQIAAVAERLAKLRQLDGAQVARIMEDVAREGKPEEPG